MLPKALGVVKQTVCSDSDEEHFSDVLESDEEGEINPKPEAPTTAVVAAWDHSQFGNNQQNKKNKRAVKPKKKKAIVIGEPAKPKPASIGYDLSARDPRFANAANQPCWQLILMAEHAHPTVSFFARNAIAGTAFKYTGDPFDDLSVNHFIERFVYKKPKAGVTVSKAREAST